jgi:hypothetical protein
MVSRILLRSSSIYEPSDPPSKVMISFSFTFLPWLLECCTGFGIYSGGIFDNPLGYPSRSPGSKPKTRREIRSICMRGHRGSLDRPAPWASGVSQPPGTLNRWSHHPTSTSVLPPQTLGRDLVSTALGYRSTRGTRHEVSLTTAVSRSPIARVEPHPRPIISFFPSSAFRASGRTNSRLPTIFRL